MNCEIIKKYPKKIISFDDYVVSANEDYDIELYNIISQCCTTQSVIFPDMLLNFIGKDENDIIITKYHVYDHAKKNNIKCMYLTQNNFLEYVNKIKPISLFITRSKDPYDIFIILDGVSCLKVMNDMSYNFKEILQNTLDNLIEYQKYIKYMSKKLKKDISRDYVNIEIIKIHLEDVLNYKNPEKDYKKN